MIAFDTSFVNLFSFLLFLLPLAVIHAGQAVISLIDEHKSQWPLDNPPDAKQPDSGIQRHQHCYGGYPYFSADETRLHDLPQKNADHIQYTTDQCPAPVAIQDLKHAQRNQYHSRSDKRQRI